MTVTANPAATPAPVDTVTCSIDGVEVSVPKGTLIIRVAEQLGVEIPRFCDHPLLDPVAACRMCLVEIEGQPKPQPACAVTVADGMKVKTQLTSSVADTAQKGVMEFLLINHPLDCPICDKGGECPLQNQAMSAGRATSRFDGTKRTFPKPISISAQILLDRERCVSCARCTRFADQIAGDPFIELLERGAKQQVGIAEGAPFNSYFSGNVIQICPVGALTSTRYRFRSRPFDLVSVPTACEHCASGCALRTDFRRGVVLRRQAWDDPAVNEEWNCDKGRFAFEYLSTDRLTQPLVRGDDGVLHPVSWPEAVRAAAEGLASARGAAGVLTGGRLTLEDAYAYAKFARAVLGTDHVDFRARAHSDEEAQFLAASVAGSGLGVTYADLDIAPTILLVGLDPEDESPIVFLRLRRAARERGTRVVAMSPVRTRGLQKLAATWWATAPGGEAAALRSLAAGDVAADTLDADVLAGLRQDGAVILVGERIAAVPGGPSAVAAVAAATGARLAWVPRRAGDRGAVDAGLLPGLLPGGRALTEPAARAEAATAWGVAPEALPAEAGLDLSGILAAVNAHAVAVAALDESDTGDPAELPEPAVAALVVAGVDPLDLPDPDAVLAALDAVPFLVALETRPTDVTAMADVVLPVAVVTEKAGTFVDWEGRPRRFGAVFRDALTLTDARVLAMIADAMDVPLGLQDVSSLRSELAALGDRPAGATVPDVAPSSDAAPADDFRLATWRELLDRSTLLDGEEYLAATARPAVARLSAADAAALGVADGAPVTVSGPGGSVTLPVVVGDVVDHVVWLPANAAGCVVSRDLGAGAGGTVRVSAASDTLNVDRGGAA